MDILDTLTVTNANAVTVTAYRFGRIGSDGEVIQCVAGDIPDGVIQLTTDLTATLMYDGILPVAAAGALSLDDEVTCDANGRAAKSAGQWADGRVVRNASSAQDDIVEIQFYRRGKGLSRKPGTLSADGAVSVRPSARYAVTKAGVCAMTLAAPTDVTDDGVTITITSNTANAHTLTATGLLDTGTASVNLATFAAQKGAGLTLLAYNARWKVLSSVGITFS